jgi:putative Mg2+ transporter-C (MgtC) family protein
MTAPIKVSTNETDRRFAGSPSADVILRDAAFVASMVPHHAVARAQLSTERHMIGWTEVILRLAAAMVIGGMIGLDRNLHHKPTGVRTLGLVALGSALAVLTVGRDSQADISRVVQGVITGVGFIGAGVILHRASAKSVHGLTTAAAIWVTAALGVLCGLGSWHIVLVAITFVLFLLLFGGSFEKWCHKKLGPTDKPKRPRRSDHDAEANLVSSQQITNTEQQELTKWR